jgi:regulator of PEP synthase PpsR (kinase-PPPase family)
MSHHIYIFSDSTGETAERGVRAALSQFKDVDVKLHRYSKILSRDELVQALEMAVKEPGILFYTLVNPEHGQLLRDFAETHGLESVDLISPLLFKLSDFFGMAPQEVPGLLYQLDSEYYKRVEAVNFTVKQDDGQEPRNLAKADIVLVGVSRTSKTPLSMYLAHKGYKVANVPLVKGIDPPRELFDVAQDRVVGLIIEPRRLVELRSARLRNMRQTSRGSYAEYEGVVEELEFCRQFYRKHPEWLIIDVTSKSVEESAAEILKKVNYAG